MTQDADPTPSEHGFDSLFAAALDAPSGEPLPARYERREVLGSGGMGEVILAHDRDLRRDVAVKRIRPDLATSPMVAARFLEEAQVTAQLEHPHIVPVHEAGLSDGQPYYTMRVVQGENLGTVIRSDRLPLPALLRIFVQVCDAVAFAHSRGVLHRDLKPGNIMIGRFGEVFVMDWGLTKILASADPEDDAPPDEAVRSDRSEELVTRSYVGTPRYMSPEQARGDPVDVRSDVYLLGGVLYTILTATPPHPIDVGLDRGAVEPPRQRAPDREVPKEIEAVVLKALDPDPAARYPEVRSLKEEVERYLDGRRVAALRYDPLLATYKWLRRNRLPAAVLGAILLTSALVVTAFSIAGARARQRDQARARAEIDRLGPSALVTEARAALEDVPIDPLERRAPTPARRRGLRDLLDRLGHLDDALASYLVLLPGDAEIRGRRFEVLVLIGRLAEVDEDFTLARFSLDQAGRLGLDDDRVAGLLEGVERARGARLEKSRRAVVALLDRAEQGQLADEEDYALALAELTGHRERQTVELLIERLAGLTEILQAATRRILLAVREPSPDEARIGQAVLVDLEPALDRWLAPPPPGQPPPPLTDIDRDSLQDAIDRIESRERARAGNLSGPRTWQEILSAAQREALTEGGVDRLVTLRLVCEALGLLGDPVGTTDALGGYLWSDFDQVRAVPAGLSLTRLADEDSRRTLFGLVGLLEGGSRRHWTVNGYFWRRIRRKLPIDPAARRDPEAMSAHELRGRGVRRREAGDLDGAIADLTRAIELAPDLASALADRGSCHMAAERYAEAIEDLDRAIELDPGLASAYTNRGSCRLEVGDIDGSIADHTRALELDPATAAISLNNRAIARKAGGDLAGAIEDGTRAIELDPTSARAHANRGSARLATGDSQGAGEDYDRAIELDPTDCRLHASRGWLRLRLGDPTGALEDFERSLRIDPRYMMGYLGRGQSRRARGDLLGAIEDFEEAMSLDPESADPFTFRGLARHDMGRFELGIEDFDRALRLRGSKSTVQILTFRANSRHALGDGQEALADLDRAVELDPRDAEARYSRSTVRQALGQAEAALEDLDRAIELDPNEPRYLHSRGHLLEAAGELERAAADYTRALEHDSAPVRHLHCRGRIRHKLGDLEEAIADYTRAIEIDPRQAKSYANRSRARRLLGRLEGSIEDGERALRLDPSASWARSLRGEIDEARRLLENR